MNSGVWTKTTKDRRYFIGGSDARIIMGDDEAALLPPVAGKARRGRARGPLRQPHRPARRSHRGPQSALVRGAIPARSSRTSSGRSGIQRSAGWRPPSTAGSRRPGRFSRPNSCCRGRSPKRRRPKNTCPSSSTICGSRTPRRPSSRSSPVAANGWRSRSLPICLYQHLLVTAERKFWRCVESGEPPRLFGVEPPRPRIEAVRIVDMSASNSWAECAAVFRTTRAAFLEHEKAKAELKGLMPEDAKEAIGHGVRAKRSKSGAVSFDLLDVEARHAALQ